MARKKLGELLVEAGVISESSLRAALGEQRRWGGTLGRTLVEMKVLAEDDLVRILSRQLGLQPIDLDRVAVPQHVLDLVPGELAQQWSLVLFAQPMKFLDVAMSDPTNVGIVDELRIRTQLNIRPFLCGPKMIERALARYYGRGFGQFHRPDLAVSLDAGDMIEPSEPAGHLRGSQGVSATDAREGLRTFPRKASLTSPPPEVLALQPLPAPTTPSMRDAEIASLQHRLSQLEALVQRDEEVLRKLLALLIEKNVATRDEILERIR